MTTINLEDLLEKLGSISKHDDFGNLSHYVHNNHVCVDLANQDTLKKYEHSFSIQDAFLIFGVKHGLIKEKEYVKQVREIYRDKIKYSFNHEFKHWDVKDLINIARVIKYEGLAKELYREYLESCTNKMGYAYLSALNIARWMGDVKTSNHLRQKIVEITDESNFVAEYYKHLPLEKRNIYFDDAIKFSMGMNSYYTHDKDEALFFMIYRKRINNQSRKDYIAKINISLRAAKDAELISSTNMADFFNDAARRYEARYQNQKLLRK